MQADRLAKAANPAASLRRLNAVILDSSKLQV
jgi:hypothetical protein